MVQNLGRLHPPTNYYEDCNYDYLTNMCKNRNNVTFRKYKCLSQDNIIGRPEYRGEIN